MSLQQAIGLPVIAESLITHGGTTYGLTVAQGEKKLAVLGDVGGFEGETHAGSGALIGGLTASNAEALRRRLPWLRPRALGLQTSFGFGDRLGVATPGHIRAVRDSGIAPIFAQQSVRENTRLQRTPQRVMDAAMWGVFQMGWREAWGADADHLKTIDDIAPFVDAGYSFYTIDPSQYVDDSAEAADEQTLHAKVERLPWDVLDIRLDSLRERFLRTFNVDELALTFDEHTLLKAAAKYGGAIAHTTRMARHLASRMGERVFDLEMSVDETDTATTQHEHFFIVSELRRLGVRWVSLAPRFVGSFEKGIDYVGDLNELERNVANHAAIMRYFGGSYKLSVHTGSDKFSVYPIVAKYAGGLVHVKTAGTSYLEALRVVASVDPALFRDMLEFARDRFETDRVTYLISASLDNVPRAGDVPDADLPALLNQFDTRQVLHVTFGSILTTFGEKLHTILREHERDYESGLQAHFDRHLAPFVRAKKG